MKYLLTICLSSFFVSFAAAAEHDHEHAGHDHTTHEKHHKGHDHDAHTEHNQSNTEHTDEDSQQDDGHNHGTQYPLGSINLGETTFALVLHGTIEAGQSTVLDVTITEGNAPSALRAWVGSKNGRGSVKALLEADKDGTYHAHMEVPEELAQESAIWLSATTDEGTIRGKQAIPSPDNDEDTTHNHEHDHTEQLPQWKRATEHTHDTEHNHSGHAHDAHDHDKHKDHDQHNHTEKK